MALQQFFNEYKFSADSPLPDDLLKYYYEFTPDSLDSKVYELFYDISLPEIEKQQVNILKLNFPASDNKLRKYKVNDRFSS